MKLSPPPDVAKAQTKMELANIQKDLTIAESNKMMELYKAVMTSVVGSKNASVEVEVEAE